MLIVYSRIFRAVVIDKIQCEREGRLVATLPGVCPLVLGTHWLVAVAVSVTRLPETVCTEIVTSSSLNTLSGSTSFPRISGLSTGAA